jgi:hypothetical protein
MISIGNFDQIIPLSNTNKKNCLSHFGQVVFDMTDLTSQVVGYLTGQITQQSFWATNFLGQFFSF